MPEIRFSTSADLSGFRELEKALSEFEAHVRRTSDEMAKMGFSAGAGSFQRISETGSIGSFPTAGAAPSSHHRTGVFQSAGPTPPSTASQAQRNAHQSQYNFNTPSGVESWVQNVEMPAWPALQMLNSQMKTEQTGRSSGRSSSKPVNVPGNVPVISQSLLKSKNAPGSAPWYADWFARIGQPDIQSMMSPELRQSYSEARGLYVGGRDITPGEFYQNYASEANQPTSPPSHTSLWGSFKQNAKGNTLSGILGNGLKGVASGVVGNLASSGVAGDATAGALGDLLGGPLGAAVGVLSATALSLLKTGFSQWEQTSVPTANLAHSLNDAAKGVESFRSNLVKAGANVLMTGTQSVQVASLLAQNFTGSTELGLSNMVHMVGGAGINWGMSGQQVAQILSSSASQGITSGKGSSYTAKQYLGMLGNLANQTGMQGRQGPLFTGLTDVYNTLAGINPIINNPGGTMAQYAAMNKSGVQGLQGLRGAALMAQMDKSFASPSAMTQALGFTAIMRATGGKITDPFQMLSIMEQGTGAKIGNTTLGAEYQKVLGNITGNKYLQAALMPGLDINQGLSVLGSGALGAANPPSTSFNFTTTLSSAQRFQQLKDRMNAGLANMAAGPAKLVADTTTLLHLTTATVNASDSYILTATEQMQHLLDQEKAAIAALNKKFGGQVVTTPSLPNSALTNNVLRAHLGISPLQNPGAGIPSLGAIWGDITSTVGGVSSSVANWLAGIGGGSPLSSPVSSSSLKSIMAGIMQVESGGNPYSINDNTTGKSYSFGTRSAYLAEANKLLTQHHQLAMGPFQIESFHKGITPANAANLPFAANYALNHVLSGFFQNDNGNMSQALEGYSGNTLGYASMVANDVRSGSIQHISQTAADAIGQAVANALKSGSFGPIS